MRRRLHYLIAKIRFTLRRNHANAVDRHCKKLFQRQIPESFTTLITGICLALSVVENFLYSLVSRLVWDAVLLRLICHCRFTPIRKDGLKRKTPASANSWFWGSKSSLVQLSRNRMFA